MVETPIQRVDVLERLPVASCLAMKQGLADARQAYGDAGDHSVGLQAALSALVAATGGASGAEAGLAADGYGVWVRFGNGVLGAVPLGAPEGSRGAPFGGLAGGNTIGSRRVTLLEATAGPTEVARAAELLNDGTCPPFAPDGPHAGAGVTLDRLGALPGQGVLVFAGHGGVYFDGLAPHYGWRYQGPQEVLWSGEAVACDRILDHLVACQATGECPAGSACVRAAGGGHPGTCVSRVAADLLRGRVVLGPDTYGITPAFVDHYGGGRMENALVYAGACHSLYNGSLAMAFFGAGASTFVGYTGLTGAAFARQVGEHLLEGMAIDKKPAGEAMCEATDPANPETRAALVGNVGLSLDLAGLLNGSFDLPRLDGWTAEGDARRVLSFCGAKPTQGNFMALISTGLGFAEASGRLSQRFCIPAGATELSFWWRYYSAELEQSCGVPGFQDTWSVRLKTDAGTLPVTVLECRVDDMCHYEANFCKPNPCAPPSDCGCGACYEPYAPATACTFDGAQVMAGAFRKTTVNVSALAGKGPVSLVLEITDKGQPSNETAILIDDVQIR